VGTVVEFGPRFTVLWGHNGAGKTNILEALYLTSTLRSFRTADLKAMLRRGCEHARVEVEAYDPELGLNTRLEVRIDKGARSTRRSARLDGKLVRSASSFYGRIRAVLFTPEDLGVLRGSPGGRRRFVDRVLFARDRAHIGDVQRYDKLLRSRNRVLKMEAPELAKPEQTRLLDTYDVALAEVGGRIWSRREVLVADLRVAFRSAFAHIDDVEDTDDADDRHNGVSRLEAGMVYASRIADRDGWAGASAGASPRPAVGPEQAQHALTEALRIHRRRDEAARRTTVGPHLDDLAVTLDGMPAGDFASQGQARALVLAFKIAELREARERSGQPPLLLLDDVSSELDPRRSARLFETLAAEVGQCVLTTTAARHIELGGGVERRDLQVEHGRVQAAGGPGSERP